MGSSDFRTTLTIQYDNQNIQSCVINSDYYRSGRYFHFRKWPDGRAYIELWHWYTCNSFYGLCHTQKEMKVGLEIFTYSFDAFSY